MSFGAFMQGLQGGIGTMQDIRKKKQDEEIRDVIIRESKDIEANAQEELEAAGGIVNRDGLSNPYLYRLFGIGLGKPKKTRLPGGEVTVTDGAAASPDPEISPEAADPFGSQFYNDGGKVRRAIPMADGELVGPRTRYQQNREQQLSEYEKQRIADVEARDEARAKAEASRGEKVEGPKAKPSRTALPENAGRVRRAVNSPAAKGGAALALGGTALTVANTPTEQYRERFGLETNDPTFLGDLGVRTLGAASDLGNILTLGAAGNFYRDLQNRREAIPAAAPEQATSTPAPATPAATGGGAARSVAASRQAVPTSAEPAAAGIDMEEVDFSNVSPDEIPNYTSQDWTKFRERALRGYLARRMPVGQAIQLVDQQVTEMQQRGFTNFAMQGLALQEAGNLKGAMAAYRAAFQMFPSGTDVKFGVHNGKIVGVGINEETGEPEGGPMLIDSERVAAIIDNFRKPEAWQHWAKDRRDFQLTLKKYMEMEKPLAEAQGSAMLTNANAAATRANADLYAAQNVGAGGGALSGAGFRNSERVFRDRMAMMGITDPATADQLAAVMSQMKMAYPHVPDNVIVDRVMSRIGYGAPQE